MASEKKIDELDIKIIKELLRNSRTSFSEIAKKFGVTTTTINNRFNELKESGIITGSTVLVDLAHFGVECDGTLLLNVDPQRIDEFLRDSKKMLGEFFAMPQKLNDKYNVSVWSPIKNLRELENLKQSLKQHSAVIDVKTHIWTYMKVHPDNLTLETT
jgi:Lrp/AsnC family transcriptional regulator for asnA, asnC and gidA